METTTTTKNIDCKIEEEIVERQTCFFPNMLFLRVVSYFFSKKIQLFKYIIVMVKCFHGKLKIFLLWLLCFHGFLIQIVSTVDSLNSF